MRDHTQSECSRYLATQAPGVILLNEADQEIIDDLRRQIHEKFAATAKATYWAPPVISTEVLKKTGYDALFPQLVVDVVPRSNAPVLSELSLPAAMCHHIYPLLQDRMLASEEHYVVEGHCFRNEASSEPGRLRSYLVSEHVYFDTAAATIKWRDQMAENAVDWFASMGLLVKAQIAHDAFFGESAHYLGAMQMSSEQKIEIIWHSSSGQAIALASFNYHEDYFCRRFNITQVETGVVLHSACGGFGLNRILIALAEDGRHRG